MEENVHQELEQLSPLLHEMRKKPEGFQVPEGYFAQMQANVLKQLQKEMQPIAVQDAAPQKRQQTPNWWASLIAQMEWLLQPRYAVGFASIAFLVTAGWFLLKPSNSDNCTELACASDDEIHQYLEENVDEIETEQLWKTMMEESTSPTATIDETKPEDDKNNTLPVKIQNASEQEINEMIDEMIQNDELNEEDLDEIL